MTHRLISLLHRSPRLPGICFLALSTGSLGLAFFVEHVMGIVPCELCLLQRLPYVAVGLFALFALIAPPSGLTFKLAIAGIGVAFLVGAGLAFYHFGVEEKWWISTCSTTQSMDLSFEDLKASIMAADFVPCDQRSWVIFGLSITVYNTIFSLLYAFVAFTVLGIFYRLGYSQPSAGASQP